MDAGEFIKRITAGERLFDDVELADVVLGGDGAAPYPLAPRPAERARPAAGRTSPARTSRPRAWTRSTCGGRTSSGWTCGRPD